MPEVNNVEAARSMGWVPKEEFRGAEDKWVDADTFVKRGEEFMPFLRASNRRLQADLDAARAEARNSLEKLETLTSSVEELKKTSIEETKRQVKEERVRVLADLKKAKKDGDTDLEVELGDDLRRIDKALDKADEEPPVAKKKEDPAPVIDPAYLAWKTENAWLDVDRVKSATAYGIAQDIRADAANAGLVGKAFFDEVSRRLDEIYGGGGKKRTTPKVDPATGGGGRGGSVKRGYDDLPAEAKAVVEKQTTKMVGDGRAFKTKEAWHAHYVEQYFAGEDA